MRQTPELAPRGFLPHDMIQLWAKPIGHRQDSSALHHFFYLRGIING